jgi:predicted anti-sigma-YlaC factor YlaD
MYCEDYQQRISADLDGELSAADERLLWKHLASCETCRAWRRDQMQIRAALQQWPEEELPAIPTPRVTPPVTATTRVYRVPRVLAWAAALLLLLQGAYVTSTLVGGPQISEETSPMLAEDEVETIVLTEKNRVSYSTFDNPLAIGNTLHDLEDNGG